MPKEMSDIVPQIGQLYSLNTNGYNQIGMIISKDVITGAFVVRWIQSVPQMNLDRHRVYDVFNCYRIPISWILLSSPKNILINNKK